jgi:hypothetical protein
MMSEYRIKKGGRVFTATRLETLERLVAQGMLRPDDMVSVDGAEFVPADRIEALEPLLAAAATVTPPHDDPWRHWGGEGELDSAEDNDNILTSFLGQIHSGTAPAIGEAALTRPEGSIRSVEPLTDEPEDDEQRPSHVVRAEPDPSEPATAEAATPDDEQLKSPAAPPGQLSAVLSAGRGRRIPSSRLPSVEPEPLDDDDLPPAEPAEEPEPPALTPAEPEPPATPSSSFPGGPSASGGDDQAELPVSFKEWLDKRDGAQDGGLEGFGRYDDGVVAVGGRKEGPFNVFRVLLIVLLGAIAIGFWWMWVSTVATTGYPAEADLIRGPVERPTEPSTAGDDPATAAPVAEGIDRARLERERTIREGLGGILIQFHTPEELEDAFFRELANRGASPMSVEVDSIHQAGTQDIDHRRPTQANLVLELRGVPDDDYEALEDVLMLSWMLVGKYQTLGKIAFERVEVKVAPPLPFHGRYEGRRLAAYWGKAVSYEELFLRD